MSLKTKRAAAMLAAIAMCACQSPTDPDEAIDIIEVTVSPSPAAAAGPTGRTYTVSRTDGSVETREYDWKATFTIDVLLTEDAGKEEVGMDFPLEVTSATVQVQQASSGIITPPTGSETERYEFVIAQTTSNRFSAASTRIQMTFDVWYDLPNNGREARINVTLGFRDDGSLAFSEVVPVTVGP
jgi:hypothetical protein